MIFEQLSGFLDNPLKNKRLLGLDVGKRTIGVAMSDTLQTIATPTLVIKRTKFMKDVEIIKGLISEHEIGGIVVGLPLSMDGSLNIACQSVKQFAKNLYKEEGLPILLWDERMSTVAVSHALNAAEMHHKKQSKVIDKMAASFILQGVLDCIRD